MQKRSHEHRHGAFGEHGATVPYLPASLTRAVLLSVPEIASLPQDNCDAETGFRKMCKATLFPRAALWPSSSPKTSIFSSLRLELGALDSQIEDFKSKGWVMMGHLHNSRRWRVKQGVKNERNPVVSGLYVLTQITSVVAGAERPSGSPDPAHRWESQDETVKLFIQEQTFLSHPWPHLSVWQWCVPERTGLTVVDTGVLARLARSPPPHSPWGLHLQSCHKLREPADLRKENTSANALGSSQPVNSKP